MVWVDYLNGWQNARYGLALLPAFGGHFLVWDVVSLTSGKRMMVLEGSAYSVMRQIGRATGEERGS